MKEKDHLSSLRKRVAKAPTEPGVYRWLNDKGEVLYVGKAKNLRNRMKSYVTVAVDKAIGPWKLAMRDALYDFDITVVNSELEALILETNLIKEFKPRYNVAMKDDKNYVYLRITLNDAYPRIEVTRKMEKDGAKYFGPYLRAYELKQTLDMLHTIFRFRACDKSLDVLNRCAEKGETLPSDLLKPCLEYQIGRCCGLCAGAVTKEEYGHAIDAVMAFFRGDHEPVLQRAHALMMEAAAKRKFEKAAELRNTIRVIEEMKEKQIASDTSIEDLDVVGVALLAGKAQVVIFHKRGGKLIGEDHFALMGKAETIQAVLEQFLPQYYAAAGDLPAAVVVGEEIEERGVLETFLTERRGKQVKILVPERGNKSHLLALAEKNAQEKAKQSEIKWEAESRNIEEALKALAEAIGLENPPHRIEGYDISHLGGTETVGSMTVVIDGKPRNDLYRSFTIHTMQKGTIDDYRALKEVLMRRLRHLLGGLKWEEGKWNEQGITFAKAKKEDQGSIEEILARHAEELSQKDIDYKQFMVARHDGNIIGFGRIREHEGGIKELSSIWVDDQFRGGKLGQFVARLLLKSVKKGKVYVRIPPTLEPYYASLGFRHMLKAPPVLQARMDAVRAEHPDAPERIAMMYDSIKNKIDASLSDRPDLLVIDGGKGQLGVALEALRELKLEIPAIGLAKREEEIFLPGKMESIILPSSSPAKFLIMRLRDEAHRFANRHREKRGAKTAVMSAIDRVPGIGPETRVALMKKFGSADGVRKATDEELKEVLNDEQLKAVKEFL